MRVRITDGRVARALLIGLTLWGLLMIVPDLYRVIDESMMSSGRLTAIPIPPPGQPDCESVTVSTSRRCDVCRPVG
jgi:hypothetical protein